MCVVVRRYIDFLILLIPTPLVYICQSVRDRTAVPAITGVQQSY